MPMAVITAGAQELSYCCPSVYSTSISGANEPRWVEVTVAHVGGLPLCWRLRFIVSDRALGQVDAYLFQQ